MSRVFYALNWIVGLGCVGVGLFHPPFNAESVICAILGLFILSTNRHAWKGTK